MLEYVNFFLIIIIIAILVFEVISMISMKKALDEVQHKADNPSISLMNLKEFSGIDPSVKRNYEQYVLNGLVPVVTEVANDFVQSTKLNTAITAENDAIIRGVIGQVGQQMRSSLPFPPSTES